MRALRGLLHKEVLHILRDRRTLTVLLLLPVVQVVIFGFAVRTDVEDVRLAVVDPRPDHATLRLRARLTAGGVFRQVAVLRRAAELDPLFESGAAQAAMVFAPGFAEDLGRGLPARLLLVTDASEPNTGAAIAGYALAVVGRFERELVEERPGAAGGRPVLRIEPRVRLAFNPTAESKNLFVPGLMAFVLTIISSLMTAITLAREKETGTMETLLVSPLRPWQIVVGKVAPYLVVGFVSVIAVVVEARLIFDVPLAGSVLLLLAEGLLFILVSLALGVLISARTSSQRVAMTGALVGTMLPTMMLSGFIFPVDGMPRPLELLSHLVPAKWFVEIARGIMLKGVGLDHLWQETLILAVMAAVLLVASARSFDERLE
ncbi:MAG TPA: ABC transporter permease [Thermoanaerobaculia bacterium]|nr:ABC transporter permease [Thermoanaerobaculia bacterium]